MITARLAKAAFRRLRRHAPPPLGQVEVGPIYRTVSGRDVVGCRVCLALRELLTFTWSTDPARFNKLMDDGGCYPSAAGMAHTRIEHGEEFSLFRMVLSPVDERMGEMPALWFSNGDMVVEGTNEPAGRGPAPWSNPTIPYQ
jgi:hypothetical protein